MEEMGLAVGLDDSATCEGGRDVVGCDVEFAVGSASAWDMKDSTAKSCQSSRSTKKRQDSTGSYLERHHFVRRNPLRE